MQERKIPGFNGDYTASEDGNIYSYKSGKRHRMKQFSTGYDNQYLGVHLWRNGKRTPYRVHKLMLMAFRKPKKHYQNEINHRDGNQQNNHIDNLEWCDRSENEQHKNFLKKCIAFEQERREKYINMHTFDMQKYIEHKHAEAYK